MCKIPGFQDLPESISRIQGQKKLKKKKKSKTFSRVKTKVQEFFQDSRISGAAGHPVLEATFKNPKFSLWIRKNLELHP